MIDCKNNKNEQIERNDNKNNKNKERILIIYPCLQYNICLQQNIVFIKQFLNELLDNYELFILTARDTLKLIIDKNVNIIVNNITEKSILNILEKYDIKKIIPIDCDLKCITNITKKNREIDNFFTSFYNNLESDGLFKKKARIAGFTIKKKLKEHKKQSNIRTFCFFFIKDGCNEQIMFDNFEVIYLNNGVIFNTNISIDVNFRRKIEQFIRNFGELLVIQKYPYIIQISVDDVNEIVYFDKIQYSLCDEMIFSIQRQNINLPKTMLLITRNLHFFYQKNNNIVIAEKKRNDNFFSMFFTTKKCDNCNYSLNNSNSIDSVCQNNDYEEELKINELIDYANVKPVNCLDYRNNCVQYVKKTTNSIINNFSSNELLNEFIIVYLGKEFSDDINNQLFFCKICSLLAIENNVKILLLSDCLLPIYQLLFNFNIVIKKTLNKHDIKEILNKYYVNRAYIVPSEKNIQLTTLMHDFGLKVYCKNNDKNNYYTEFDNIKNSINKETYSESRDKSNSMLNNNKVCEKENEIINSILNNSKEKICFSCIIDEKKEMFLKFTTSSYFKASTNTLCYFYPKKIIDYSVQDKINDVITKIINKIPLVGFLNIKLVYHDGNVYIQDIKINTTPMFLYFYKNLYFTYQVLLDVILNSVANNNIKSFKNDIFLSKNNNKICFEFFDKQVIVIEEVSENKVFKKFKNL